MALMTAGPHPCSSRLRSAVTCPGDLRPWGALEGAGAREGLLEGREDQEASEGVEGLKVLLVLEVPEGVADREDRAGEPLALPC